MYGEYTSVRAIASNKDGVAFCTAGEGGKGDCLALSYATGAFTKLPTIKAGGEKTKPSTAGDHLLEAKDKQIVVCGRDAASGAKKEPCTTLDVGPYTTHAGVPADVSPDGKKVVFIRELGTGFTVDIYDLATKARDKRFGVRGESFATYAAWPGKRIFMTSCVDAGPGCNPMLLDPETEKSTRPGDINVHGVDGAMQRVSGSLFGFVDSTGGTIAFADVDTGAKKEQITVPLSSDVVNGVSVVRREGNEIAIVAGGPQLGHVQLVDLATKKAGKKFQAPRCK
jgi:hypothetical protein